MQKSSEPLIWSPAAHPARATRKDGMAEVKAGHRNVDGELLGLPLTLSTRSDALTTLRGLLHRSGCPSTLFVFFLNALNFNRAARHEAYRSALCGA